MLDQSFWFTFASEFEPLWAASLLIAIALSAHEAWYFKVRRMKAHLWWRPSIVWTNNARLVTTKNTWECQLSFCLVNSWKQIPIHLSTITSISMSSWEKAAVVALWAVSCAQTLSDPVGTSLTVPWFLAMTWLFLHPTWSSSPLQRVMVVHAKTLSQPSKDTNEINSTQAPNSTHSYNNELTDTWCYTILSINAGKEEMILYNDE